MNLPTNPVAAPAAPAHILVVEDEPSLSRLVADYLKAAGYTTQQIDHGDAVLPAVQARMPDLIVLDLMLPGTDGLTLCRAIRGFSPVPVLMLTARVDEVDRLIGLDAGADDYVCKPFSPREVVARVKAILRRQQLAVAAATTNGAADGVPRPGLVLDDARHKAELNGRDLGLTPLEFRLLAALAAAPGRVFSRDGLLDKLHDDQRALSDRAIDSHIKNLRRKLAQASPGLEPIRSVYGVGYALELD